MIPFVRRVFAGLLLASSASAQPVDNCASMLGSIGIELRHARNLAPGARTSFNCPRETAAMLGAERQRIFNALGTPDATGRGQHPGLEWSYFFSSAAAGERGPGIPELVFSFDERQKVSAVRCQRTR